MGEGDLALIIKKGTNKMDIFFTQPNCDRCGASFAGGRTMSMFNTDTICMACKAAEQTRSDFEAAREAERAACAAGDRNFKGIGLK